MRRWLVGTVGFYKKWFVVQTSFTTKKETNAWLHSHPGHYAMEWTVRPWQSVLPKRIMWLDAKQHVVKKVKGKE